MAITYRKATSIKELLTTIHEFKGRQSLFIEANSDKLVDLLEIAKIQSIEYSNKIEGIYTSNDRLRQENLSYGN